MNSELSRAVSAATASADEVLWRVWRRWWLLHSRIEAKALPGRACGVVTMTSGSA